MNINSNYQENEDLSPENVMDQGMNFIFEKLIDPMKGKLNEEDLALISIIGVSFKMIAEQAGAYEKIQSEEYKESPYIRN